MTNNGEAAEDLTLKLYLKDTFNCEDLMMRFSDLGLLASSNNCDFMIVLMKSLKMKSLKMLLQSLFIDPNPKLEYNQRKYALCTPSYMLQMVKL